MEIKKIAVIGAGVMGHGIAHVYAQNGLNVALVDTNEEILEQAREATIAEVRMLQEEGLTSVGEEEVLAKIQFTTDLDGSVSDVDYIAEAVSENMELKKEIFKKLDQSCPQRTIFASNTSFLPIRELAAVTDRADKVIGAHWDHPPHIIPLVELVPTGKTSDETINTAIELHEGCGKVPICLKRDVHGFMPRMMAVFQTEAIRCLEEMLASAGDIDKMVIASIGFRISNMGPLSSLDDWHIDLFKEATDFLVGEFNDERFRSPKLVNEMIAEGRLSMMVGKGFYDYTGVDISEVRRLRDRKFCKHLKALKESGAI